MMRLLVNKQVNTPKNFHISGFLPEFKNEVIIDGAYYFSENNAPFHVSGSLRTEISVCCDRCLKPFTSVLQTTFEEEFMSKI